MKYKGHEWKLNRNYWWRPFDATRDDPEGKMEGIGPNYCVIVRMEGCVVEGTGCISGTLTRSQPAIGIGGWFATNQLYGKAVAHRRSPLTVDGITYSEHWARRVYLVYDGWVYTRTHRMIQKPG